MKLYEVPRNTYIRLIDNVCIPPEHRKIEINEVLKFHHIDGIYSYCTDKDGNKVHPAAWTEVEVVNDKLPSS